MTMSKAMTDVMAERGRQQSSEGFSTWHDDGHDLHQLAHAAFCYIGHATDIGDFHDAAGVPEPWPWSKERFKPTSPRRDIVKAAALLVAEIERLDRASKSQED